MKYLSIAISLLLCQGISAISKEEAQKYFEEGNAYYESGDFSMALDIYKKIGNEYQSFEYYFNLGNTYYELDSIAPAILNYERSAKINAGDEDLITNLKIANQRVRDKIDALPTLGVQNLWDRITSSDMLQWWGGLSLTGWILALTVLAAYFFSTSLMNRRFYMVAFVLLLFTTLVGFGLGKATENRISQSQEAIIMNAKVDVWNKPKGDEIQFVLHEGTKVKIRQDQGDWVEIKISNGSVGWVRKIEYEGV